MIPTYTNCQTLYMMGGVVKLITGIIIILQKVLKNISLKIL